MAQLFWIAISVTVDDFMIHILVSRGPNPMMQAQQNPQGNIFVEVRNSTFRINVGCKMRN